MGDTEGVGDAQVGGSRWWAGLLDAHQKPALGLVGTRKEKTENDKMSECYENPEEFPSSLWREDGRPGTVK